MIDIANEANATRNTIEAYYDERVEGKLRDFTDFNPRIEAAIQTIAEWAPPAPRRVLEIGCGIGATSWRMARAWSQAEVIGADISSRSIEVARNCFRLPNLAYHLGLIREGVLAGKFDLVVLMDVYEHIVQNDRAALHAAINPFLADEARVIMTFPTPALQQHGRLRDPAGMQPVDEDVTVEDILKFAEQTCTDLLYYREVGIWQYGDYAHAVLGRYEKLANVALREYHAGGLVAVKHYIRRLLGLNLLPSPARRDYLGSDVLRPSPRQSTAAFCVPESERQRMLRQLRQPIAKANTGAQSRC